ncbi:MAG TPA: CDP-2,3-bis-(O-geranylgeranyl)-sn-glycerol synthase [Candidatus Sulfotelmatobacter sp.]|nr:CDP-2,3-bis-(O-geranylgeranyl)-sn-glycerol synthase [Candidatus Sulfotelmatobacter sp.]
MFLDAALFIGPSYVANAAPLLFGGGTPLDGGRNFLDGQRIFGAHKTVRGLFAGIIAGSVIGLAESPVDNRLLLGGFVIALGTVLGDLLGAFFKRRVRIEPGSPLPIVDQLDFVFGGLVLGNLVFPLSWWSILIVVLVTPPIHLGTNYGAYLLGIKRTRW